jgi:hypothetical protein
VADEFKEIQHIDRGVKAEKLLKDPLLIEAFEAVHTALQKAWSESPVRDMEGREKLFLMIKAAKDVRGYLEQAVRDGKVAVHSREERRLFGIFKR